MVTKGLRWQHIWCLGFKPIPQLGNVKAVFLFLSILISFGFASQSGPDDVTWTIVADPDPVQAGESTMIRFVVELSPDWYLYAMDSEGGKPLEIDLMEMSDGLDPSGVFTQSEPDVKYDVNFEMDVRSFEGIAEFETEVFVAQEAEGEANIKGEIRYQYCNANICIPANEEFELSFTISPSNISVEVAEDATEVTPPVKKEEEVSDSEAEKILPIVAAVEEAGDSEKEAVLSETKDVKRSTRPMVAVEKKSLDASLAPIGVDGIQKSKGLWAFLLLAFGAGFAALLTPCVFPMIPLTISFFSKQSGNRGQAVRMSLLYGLSIIVIFTALGVLMALLVGAAGAQTIASNPWINLFIGVVFVAFALSLLGMFELRLPNGLLNYFNRKSSEGGTSIAGVLFMGTTLTLVSFSCTAPFVGALLATAASKEFIWPILGMVAFSGAFALPFIFFAMFPKWLESLPRSGSWMNVVKVTLGFVELAAAFKFLSNADLVWQWGLLSRPLVIAAWIVIFAVAGIYLLGKIRIGHEPLVEKLGTGRMLMGMSFLALSLYLIPGLLGGPLNNLDAYLPPRQATDIGLAGITALAAGSQDSGELNWLSNNTLDHEVAMSEAFSKAQTQNKPIFVDFTGYTCSNCRQMESTVFRQTGVARSLTDDFVLLQLYTDHPESGRELQKYQLQLTGTVALPTYAILTPQGELLHLWAGMASKDEFLAFLNTGRGSFKTESVAVAD